MSTRREFITLLGGASMAWPIATGAQQTTPVIAVLSGRTNRYPAFQKGVAETGYIDGRNVHIEFHSVEGRYDQLPARARELVGRPVTVIAPMGIEAAQAAKDATTSIPIVFVFGVDPLAFGFVSSLNRPGSNITGMSLYTVELQEKRIDLLHELIANGAPIGMVVNGSQTDTPAQVKIADTAAQAKGASSSDCQS
jgi:putative ABC transport system substrate-binding protein